MLNPIRNYITSQGRWIKMVYVHFPLFSWYLMFLLFVLRFTDRKIKAAVELGRYMFNSNLKFPPPPL